MNYWPKQSWLFFTAIENELASLNYSRPNANPRQKFYAIMCVKKFVSVAIYTNKLDCLCGMSTCYSVLSKRTILPNVNYNIRTVIGHGRVLNKRWNAKDTLEQTEKRRKPKRLYLSVEQTNRKTKEPFQTSLWDERWFYTELPSLHLKENQIEK